MKKYLYSTPAGVWTYFEISNELNKLGEDGYKLIQVLKFIPLQEGKIDFSAILIKEENK